jgi:hypothetical protein
MKAIPGVFDSGMLNVSWVKLNTVSVGEKVTKVGEGHVLNKCMHVWHYALGVWHITHPPIMAGGPT